MKASIFSIALLSLSQRCFSYVGPSLPRKSKNDNSSSDVNQVVAETSKETSTTTTTKSFTVLDRRLFLGSMVATTLMASAISQQALAEEYADETINQHKNDGSADVPATTMISDATATVAPIDWNTIVKKASKKALGGGKAGASAAVVQVLGLMWLRTSMNYQYRYGGNLFSSLNTLWKEGGIPRLYQGLPFAIVQGPLTRFGDTAANVGILTLLESTPETQSLPLPLKTAIGSISAGLWRIVLMPIDASKTVMQVEGSDGLKNLWSLAGAEGPAPLYQGAVASALATAVGHFPWYLTYNYLNDVLPQVSSSDDLLVSLGRSAFIGFCSSSISDVCSNSLRVIKTTKQTARLGLVDKKGEVSEAPNDVSYSEVVKLIIEKDGVLGLFGRGLQTRLLTNSVQGAVFSVLWRYFQQAGGAA